MRAIPQKKRPGVELNTNNVIKLKRKRIKKINPLWIIAGLLAAILIAVLVILVRGGAEGIAETGSVTVDVDYNAVIVRKEKVITSEAFDLADYFAEEGAWVEPDTKIMQIYRRGYSEEQAAALMRKHAEIYDEQLALLGETRDKTIRGYNELIALLEENIAEELMAGNSAEVPDRRRSFLMRFHPARITCAKICRKRKHFAPFIRRRMRLRRLWRPSDTCFIRRNPGS